jgi:catechol 2,3-dioxygenase-like lactoylglutathione lyase family enzyme
MLRDKDTISTVAVKDLAAARKFYEGVLALRPLETDESDTVTYKTGTSRLLVYRSQFAGTNQATSVTWSVGTELEEIVNGLKGKGVAFEHYKLPNLELRGDIHVGPGDFKVAWFKDPDGNIFSLFNR